MPCIQHVHSRIRHVLAIACPNQRRDRACPRSPEASAASSASTPATPGTRPRSYGSDRRDRFESRLAPARSGTRIRRSIDPDRKAQRWDHRQHGGSLWSGTKGDWCEAPPRSPRDLSKTGAWSVSLRPGLRCAPRRPARSAFPRALDAPVPSENRPARRSPTCKGYNERALTFRRNDS